MGGEGSAMAANTSLKNNRNLLSKRKEKASLEGSYSGIELKKFPKATEADLIKIRERMELENKKWKIKLLILSGCIIAIVVSFMLYFFN